MKAIALALVACMLPSVAHADECHVDYVTVPDGVKQVIEGWVSAEPTCRGTIALRVIPTKDGYFLFAQRPDGTVHERLVPDLTAAGVLVASWIADSWRIERTERTEESERPRKKKRKAIEASPVAATDERANVAKAVVIPQRVTERKRWVSLGGTFVAGAEGADVGFRLDADILTFGAWKVGLVLQKVEDTMRIAMGAGVMQGQIDDWSFGAVVSRTIRWRGWELRGGAGVYALGSELHAEDFYDQTSGSPISAWEIAPSTAFELSASLHRDIGERWGVALTTAGMFISQPWNTYDNDPYAMPTSREQLQTTWVASLRRKL